MTNQSNTASDGDNRMQSLIDQRNTITNKISALQNDEYHLNMVINAMKLERLGLHPPGNPPLTREERNQKAMCYTEGCIYPINDDGTPGACFHCGETEEDAANPDFLPLTSDGTGVG